MGENICKIYISHQYIFYLTLLSFWACSMAIDCKIYDERLLSKGKTEGKRENLSAALYDTLISGPSYGRIKQVCKSYPGSPVFPLLLAASSFSRIVLEFSETKDWWDVTRRCLWEELLLIPMGLEPKPGACEVTQWIKMLATKPHNLSSIPGTQLQRPMPHLHKISKMQ